MSHRKMNEIATQTLREIGVHVRSPDEPVAILSGVERQSVTIGRAMHFGAKLLILDEPTASPCIKESQKVLDYVLEAKERGFSIIFINHNIYHVYSVADRFTILEHGHKVEEFAKSEVSAQEIIEVIRSGQRVAGKDSGGGR